MSKPVVCSRCHGKGLLTKDSGDTGFVTFHTIVKCPRCRGTAKYRRVR